MIGRALSQSQETLKNTAVLGVHDFHWKIFFQETNRKSCLEVMCIRAVME